MRVTLILPQLNMSGGIRVLAIYADRLRRRGHHVTVVSVPSGQGMWWNKLKRALFGQERNLWARFLASLKKRRRTAARPQVSHFDCIDVPVRVLDRFLPLTDNDVPDADVVVATWWETAEWVAELSPSKGAKAYFIQGYEIFDNPYAERLKATWRMPLHKITVSKWLVELAAREFGDQHVWLVPNSVDTNQFFVPPRTRQQHPTVGFIYSTAKLKGVEVALKAIELAATRVPGLRVVAFGSEPLEDQIPLPPNASYSHLPAQDLIRNLYGSCDVWLCSSFSEGFGLPALEAMACRCPVVSTDAGGPTDFIKAGWNGYLVPVGDSGALADRLVDILKLSEADWRTMSDAAFATATQYTWDDAANLMENALRDIVSERFQTEKMQ